tara:strand:- start:6421 stop:7566 length:1146 start_codon:yes stop_codon:yes gene_type:complete
MKIVIRTYAGFEEILAKEIQNITGKKPVIAKRAITIEGENKEVYLINLWSRLAIDVLIPIIEFRAKNEDDLYKKTTQYNWEKHLTLHETFSINSIVHSPFFNHSKYVSLKVKDAIVDRFNRKENKRPNVDRENPDLRFVVRVTHDKTSILWNTSGESLYKRGYRTKTGLAPINEILAAGILTFSNWDMNTPLIDPMCGSGTFLCEALMMAKNIPAGINRNEFGFIKHNSYDHKLWINIKEDAEEKINKKAPDLYGYDNEEISVSNAKHNLSNVDSSFKCTVEKIDFFKSEKPVKNGMMIMNPPYNIRIQQDEILEFYNEIGRRLKHHWSGFDAWVFSGDLQALKRIGLRPKRRIALFNGSIESKLVHLPLYMGSKRKGPNN